MSVVKGQVLQGLEFPGGNAAYVSLTAGSLRWVLTGTTTPAMVYTDHSGTAPLATGLTQTDGRGNVKNYLDTDVGPLDLIVVIQVTGGPVPGTVLISGIEIPDLDVAVQAATTGLQKQFAEANAWSTGVSYVPGQAFTSPEQPSLRRLVAVGYRSGATFGAADTMNTVVLGLASVGYARYPRQVTGSGNNTCPGGSPSAPTFSQLEIPNVVVGPSGNVLFRINGRFANSDASVYGGIAAMYSANGTAWTVPFPNHVFGGGFKFDTRMHYEELFTGLTPGAVLTLAMAPFWSSGNGGTSFSWLNDAGSGPTLLVAETW